ncbi:MAG: tyrosine-type recombinase/integrase [Dissulfurispiraceae bacterium]
MPLDYARAERQLTVIRTQIESDKFDPEEWTKGKIAEREFSLKIELWLRQRAEDCTAGEIAPETLRLYRSYNKNHFEPFFKGMDVIDIKDETLKDFKDVVRKKPLSLKMKRNILAIFHVFLVWLKNEDKSIKDIPIKPVIEGDDTVTIKVTEYEDQKTILQRIPKEYVEPIEFMMETGLRPGEVCALWISDISLSRQEATIQRTYSGHVLKNTTKGRNKKSIPLSDRAIEIIQRNMNNRVGNVPLFINPRTGRGFKTKTLQNAWAQYSGLNSEIHLKDATRHSFCTQIVESGASQLEAMALMRHTDIRSTLKYYHADTKKLRYLVNRRGNVQDISYRTGTEREK